MVGNARGFVRILGPERFNNALSVMMDGREWSDTGKHWDRVYFVGIAFVEFKVGSR